VFRLGLLSGNDVFEILADGRRSGITVLGSPGQEFPDHCGQAWSAAAFQ
jgi:hypothetical protein